MKNEQTSNFSNGLIWFGAGVSIAEIITGTYLAPLGFQKGLTAIVIGHIIGCILLFLAGCIGGRRRLSSMESGKLAFGKNGSKFFAILNVLQLIGWTGIMIYDGALAANSIFSVGSWFWILIIGLLIILWILIGIRNLGKLNTFAMIALFALTIVLCCVIFGSHHTNTAVGEAMSFGAAVELSVAMPLSWLPLISDYTRDARHPAAATATSSITYGLVSCWMYLIGMGTAIFTGESDIAAILLKAGLGIAGLAIIILSTVTTTFLDAFSAGVSSVTISGKLNAKWIGIGVTIIGMIGAILFPMDNITDFLYLIGSVFAPMIAIQIVAEFFFQTDHSEKKWDGINLLLWAVGFLLYRYLMKVELPFGNTLPDMILTGILTFAVSKFRTK